MGPVFVEDVLPSSAEREFYEETGWLLTGLVVSDEYLERCAAAIDELHQAKYDSVLPWSTHKAVVGFGQAYADRSRPRMDSYVSHHKEVLSEVLRAPHLGRYAAELLGTSEIRLWRDLLLTMPAGSGGHTGLHVDKNYWSTASSELLTSAWFSLSDCDASGGCMLIASGSHRWPHSSVVKKLAVGDIDGICRSYGVRPEAIKLEAVPQKRGQISFHCARVLHGSLPNVSAQERRTLVVTLQDRDNHYVAPVSAEEAKLAAFCLNDLVGPSRDNVPDYGAAGFYPVIYRAPLPSVTALAQEG